MASWLVSAPMGGTSGATTKKARRLKTLWGARRGYFEPKTSHTLSMYAHVSTGRSSPPRSNH